MGRRGRGEGSIVKTKDGTYFVRISLGVTSDGKRIVRSATAKDKTEAKNKLRELQGQQAEGILVNSSKQSVYQYIDHWLQHNKRLTVKDKTLESYRFLLEKSVRPYIGDIPFQKTTAQQLDYLFSKLEDKGATARRRRMVHDLLRQAFKSAVPTLLVRSPMEGRKAPRAAKAEMKVWNEAEVHRFLQHTQNSWLYPLYLTALTCGFRQGELLGLHWAEVNLATRDISIRQNLVELLKKLTPEEAVIAKKKNQVIFRLDEPKSKSAIRVLKAPVAVIAALKQHREKMFAKGLRTCPLVFPNMQGSYYQKSYLILAFKKACREAGVPPIRFHDLRHTMATMALAQGVPVKVLQERLGHSQITLTLDTYAHVLPSMQEAASDRMDEMLLRKPAEPEQHTA